MGRRVGTTKCVCWRGRRGRHDVVYMERLNTTTPLKIKTITPWDPASHVSFPPPLHFIYCLHFNVSQLPAFDLFLPPPHTNYWCLLLVCPFQRLRRRACFVSFVVVVAVVCYRRRRGVFLFPSCVPRCLTTAGIFIILETSV